MSAKAARRAPLRRMPSRGSNTAPAFPQRFERSWPPPSDDIAPVRGGSPNSRSARFARHAIPWRSRRSSPLRKRRRSLVSVAAAHRRLPGGCRATRFGLHAVCGKAASPQQSVSLAIHRLVLRDGCKPSRSPSGIETRGRSAARARPGDAPRIESLFSSSGRVFGRAGQCDGSVEPFQAIAASMPFDGRFFLGSARCSASSCWRHL